MSTIFVFFEQTFIRMTNTVAFFAEFSSVLPFFELYTFLMYVLAKNYILSPVHLFILNVIWSQNKMQYTAIL